ncbi:MAG: ROK family transcriptional regulator [Planctomycetes bacterium]|nr:ROK family transcriptional regulator [Planctomycetota bacterium]
MDKNSLKSLKHGNRRQILDMVRHAPQPLSALTIAKQTGLSKVTVHSVLAYLVDKGLIQNLGKGEAGEDGGKRPSIYRLNPNYGYVISIKISEVKLIVTLADLEGRIINSETTTYPRETNLAVILRHIKKSQQTLLSKHATILGICVGVAVGCNGITDAREGIIKTTPLFASWGSNVPMRKRIDETLALGVPVHIENWIRYLAYGEMRRRSFPGDSFMIIGTEYEGMGAGLVINGHLISGVKGLSGEVGHLIVDPDADRPCVCGGIGCLAVAVSPKHVLERAISRRAEWEDSLLFQGSAKTITPEDLFAAANAMDAYACSVLDKVIQHFAMCINNVIMICDPGTVIIQGIYARAGEYFKTQLEDRVNSMALLRMDKETVIEYSELGDESTLVGAAQWVVDSFFTLPESEMRLFTNTEAG